MTFTFMQWVLMFLIVYTCIYILIDRVLRCIEQCAMARAYRSFREVEAQNTGLVKEKDDETKKLN